MYKEFIDKKEKDMNIIKIDFHGDDLISVEKDGIIYIAMKPICEGMGLNWSSQRIKLQKNKEKFNCADIGAVAEDGKIRESLCLPLENLNGWLFSINPEKVNSEIKDIVITYQNECFIVLHDYWHKGLAMKKPSNQAELVAQQMRVMTAFADELVSIEKRVSDIEQKQLEEKQLLLEMPEAVVEAKEGTTRSLCRELVNQIARLTNQQQSAVWAWGYKRLYYDYGINVSVQAKNSGKVALDIVEENDLLDDLYAILEKRLNIV